MAAGDKLTVQLPDDAGNTGKLVVNVEDDDGDYLQGVAIVNPSTGKAALPDSSGNLPVTVASLPLPTGAATSAKQDTANTSLASLDTKSPALGQALAAASIPVVLTASQISTLTPPAAISGFATSAKQDTTIASLASIDGKITAVNTGAVVIASSALPSGAATAAKQPALGTAGTASADVITVQGRASMTPLLVDGSAVTQPVSGTFWQATQPVSGTVTVTGVATAAKQPALGTAGSASTDVITIQGIASGTVVPISVASIPSHAVTNAGTFVVQSTLQANSGVDIGKLTANQSVNLAQIAGTTTDTNSGNKSAGTQRVVLATDQPNLTSALNVAVTSNIPGTAATSLGKAEDAVHASGDTGIFMLAIRDDTLGATAGTEGDYEGLHTTATGALWVTQTPSTTGGWTPFFAAAVTTSVQTVKGSAGVLGTYYIYNPNATVAYVQIFDISGAVTLGTSVAKQSLAIPPTSAANLEIGNGMNFVNAIKFACTTTATGLTAPGTGLDCNFGYA